jgi:hypothetical protein
MQPDRQLRRRRSRRLADRQPQIRKESAERIPHVLGPDRLAHLPFTPHRARVCV